MGLLACIVVSANAVAQDAIVNDGLNHVICTKPKIMDEIVRGLKQPDDLKIFDHLPETGPGCAWNRTPINVTADGLLGWRYAGDYIYSVHAIVTDAGSWLVPGNVFRLSEWNLASTCKSRSMPTKIKNGPRLILFGQGFTGKLFEECKTLVDQRAIADANSRLAEEPKLLEAGSPWYSHPSKPNSRYCLRLDELVQGLDKVVNEQQIINESRDIFSGLRSCNFRTPRDVVASRFVGLYRGRDANFLIPIQQVLYHDSRTGQSSLAFMPTFAIRTKGIRMEPNCTNRISINSESNSSITLYGSRIGTVDSIRIQTPNAPEFTPRLAAAAIGFVECDITMFRYTG